jgi:hypothetical protein
MLINCNFETPFFFSLKLSIFINRVVISLQEWMFVFFDLGALHNLKMP